MKTFPIRFPSSSHRLRDLSSILNVVENSFRSLRAIKSYYKIFVVFFNRFRSRKFLIMLCISKDRGASGYESVFRHGLLDRAVCVPGCSRAALKWISRSRECKSTYIIRHAIPTATEPCTRVHRGIFCVNARVPPFHEHELTVLYGSGDAPSDFIVTLFTPICRFMAPPLGTGSVWHRGCSAPRRSGDIRVSSRVGRALSFITPFVMSWRMKYSADFRYILVFIANF